MRNLKKTTAYVMSGFLLLLGALVLCHTMARRGPLRSMDWFYERTRMGMTRVELTRAVGLPDNVDNEIVWMWVLDRRDLTKMEDRRWASLFFSDAPGFYCLLVDDKVAAPIAKNVEGDPWTTYMEATGDYSRSRAQEALGPAPTVIMPDGTTRSILRHGHD
jgi:hypothetical protein